MEVLNDILGYRDRKIYQDDQCFSFSLDSVILANLVSLRFRDKKILDLGTGNGVIPLILSLRTNQSIVGVELQEKLSSMAWKSVCYNHLEEQISIVHMDMKEYAMSVESDSFDVITCNPPYFKYTDQTIPNFSYEKFLARHEVTITLGDVFCICRKLLKNGGKFAIVHRADRLLELFDEFRKNNIEPKRVRFIYENIHKETTLVFIEGVKNGKAGLKVEQPFVLYNEDGVETDEYQSMLREVR